MRPFWRHSFSCCHQTAPLTIAAEGAAVAKAVSIAEITKRQLRGLHQNTQIGLVADADRSTPKIAITLSLAPLDASLAGYQPPLSEDELHAAWIFDDDAERQAGAASTDAPRADGKSSSNNDGAVHAEPVQNEEVEDAEHRRKRRKRKRGSRGDAVADLE